MLSAPRDRAQSGMPASTIEACAMVMNLANALATVASVAFHSAVMVAALE